MLKKIRRRLKDHHPQKNTQIQRKAAVLIPLLEIEDELLVMLTKRSKNLSSHAGQVSFPGGKKDSIEESSLETALRETYEEIGLKPEKVEILGNLDQILSIQKYIVTPFVGLIPAEFKPIPNPDEIESVFKVPLSFFMKSSNHWVQEFQTSTEKVFLHHFDFEGYDIWGLTAKLILRLLEIGLEHIPDFPVHHPDYPTWMQRTLDYSEKKLS